ncbi:MAG: hypothetical protein ACRC9X_02145 [Bacteroidales bacterium]
MEFLLTFILVVLLLGYFGRMLFFLFIHRLIRKVAGKQNPKPKDSNQKQKTPPPQQVIPDEVGEYVDFEELK